VKIWSLDDIVNRRHVGGERYYDRDEVDKVLKRQASAAIAGMNAATAISAGQVQQAHRLRAESSPEALESERQANAILTARVAELEMQLAEAKGHIETLDRSNDRLRQKIDRLSS
jgi:Tfp pilus assembly protein FimV